MAKFMEKIKAKAKNVSEWVDDAVQDPEFTFVLGYSLMAVYCIGAITVINKKCFDGKTPAEWGFEQGCKVQREFDNASFNSYIAGLNNEPLQLESK